MTTKPVSSARSAPTRTVSALTPWFPRSVKPARVGVYEIRGARFSGRNYRRWNGLGWGGTYAAPSKLAQTDTGTLYLHGQDMTGWRGLTSDPSKQRSE